MKVVGKDELHILKIFWNLQIGHKVTTYQCFVILMKHFIYDPEFKSLIRTYKCWKNSVVVSFCRNSSLFHFVYRGDVKHTEYTMQIKQQTVAQKQNKLNKKFLIICNGIMIITAQSDLPFHLTSVVVDFLMNFQHF